MENQNIRLINRWLEMRLAEIDRDFHSSKDGWNSKVSMKGMTNGSHHIIGLAKITSDKIREAAKSIFAEIDAVSSDVDRFDLAQDALQNQLQKWTAEVQRSGGRLQNQTMLNRATGPLLSQAGSDILTLSDLAKNNPTFSTVPQNDFLGLWLEDQKILMIRSIEVELKALYAELSAAGTLRSGYRIKKAIAIWERHAKNYTDLAFVKGGELGGKKENHTKISLRINSILSEFELALPDIVFFPKTAQHSQDDSARRAAQKLFETVKSDIERKIVLAALDFNQIEIGSIKPNEIGNSHSPIAQPPQKLAETITRLAEPALKGWWNALQPETQALPQDDLLAIARAAFPNKFISRDRIRELTGTRKRGRKPIRGKPTAK